jgi:hypothetical protein
MTESLDNEISELLFRKYKLIWEGYQRRPTFFTANNCTRELTCIMGAQSFSWRVVGITRAALSIYRAVGYQPNLKTSKSQGKDLIGLGNPKIQRGHIYPRIETARELITRPLLPDPEVFISFWLERDVTVLCGPGENRKEIPGDYIKINNPNGEYFTSTSAGFRYKFAREGKLLQSLDIST